MVSETVIIGGGLAGGTAAVLLARSAVPVRLLERDTRPCDKICGEFLSVEACRDLINIGLDVDALGAVPIERLRVIAGGRTVEARLPFAARGISRRVLDEALLQRAARGGAIVERGVRVKGIDAGEVATSAGPRPASRILLATGKHDVRGAKRTAPATRGGYVGFKMHWRLPRSARTDMAGAIDLLLINGGYAGLQPVSRDIANLCLILRRDHLAAIGGSWNAVIAELMRDPAIAARLADAEPLFDQPLTIANLPYGYVCQPAPGVSPHLYRLGDQAAMTASLTGDGMALALRSAHLAAASVLAGEDAATYHARLARTVSTQVRRAMLLQRATEIPLAMSAGLRLLSLWPRLLATLASATRLPDRRAERLRTPG